MKSTALLMSIS